jgi:hypothetical protein
MFGKTFGFLWSKIQKMLSSGQLDKQPSNGPPSSEQPLGNQSDQNPQNKLSHTSFGT